MFNQEEEVRKQRFGRLVMSVLAVALLGMVVAGTGTIAAQSAPNCSNVDYVGDGTTNNPYEVSNVDKLQCINEDHANASDRTDALNSDYMLVSDIDASDTSAWNSGDGFEPIGGSFDEFNATFEGDGHEITDLTIDRSTNDVGLFGEIEKGATVANVSVVNVDITGNGDVGGLVGEIDGGAVSNSKATGTVTGSRNDLGGLVGILNSGGPVSGSHAEVDVSGDGSDDDVGGLIGDNDEMVTDSYSTGDVSGDGETGGFIGKNDGQVTNSYATGNVTGTGNDEVGGLIGENDAPLSESYATGDVDAFEEVGGLIGDNRNSKVTESYATGDVNGSKEIGGFVGDIDSSGDIDNSYATGAVTGSDRVGGFAGLNNGTVSETYATGEVNGSSRVGGLVGNNGDTVSNSYWDTVTTNQSSSDGGNGLTTDEMTGSDASGNMSGFDFSNTWTTVAENDYPKLSWRAPPDFDVEILSTNSPLPEGNTLEVETRITNRGFLAGTQDIPLRIDGSSRDVVIDLNLQPMESAVRTLEWNTGPSDNGTYTATVESENDTETTDVSVGQKPTFDVSIVSTNSPVQEKETLEVTAEIDNTGSVSDTQEVVLDVNGERDSTDVSVSPNSNKFETLTWMTGAGDAGTYTAEVRSEDENDSTGVTVQRNSSISPADYQISNLTPKDATATEGGSPIGISVDVDNVGERPGDQNLTLEVENSSGVQYNDTLSNVVVNGGDTTTETFTGVPVGNLSKGDYNHTVSSANDTVSGNLTVQSPGGGPSGVDQYRDDPSDPTSDVSLSGLQSAISDFVSKSISLSVLQDVIQEFIAT